MAIHAIYEDGVFKPLEKVNLPEHAQVKIEPILPSADPSELLKRRDEFWKTKTLDELAAEQGITDPPQMGRDFWSRPRSMGQR